MTPVARIIRDYTEAGSLDALVGIQSMTDSRTVVTARGDVLSILKAEPVDPDCLDPGQLDRVARTFERAIRTFDPQLRLYQYLLKRKGAVIPCRSYAAGVVNEAVTNRTAFLNSRSADHYTIEIYFVVVYTGFRQDVRSRSAVPSGWRSAIRKALSTQTVIGTLEGGLEQASRVLAQRVDAFVEQMRDTVPFTVLSSAESFQFLRRLVNYAPHKSENARLKYPTFLARQLTDSALECQRDHLRLDDYYVQVLSLKEPPAHTFAHLLRELLQVPGDMIVVTEWQREENSRMRRLIQSKRRHFHNTKTSLASQLTVTPQTSSKDLLTDHSAVALVDELGQALEAMEIGGRHFGRFSLSVIPYDLDRAAVQRSAVACTKVFAAHDASLIEESFNLLNAWLASVPGNDHFNLRRLWLSSTNYADLSLLFAPQQGEAINRHLNAEYLLALETEGGVPYYLNLHHQDVGHTLVLGATGSGKSFLLNALVTNLQKYAPFTFIFDLGGSYDTLTRHLGGAYTAIGAAGTLFPINPFSLSPTPENRHFLAAFCRVLIESGGYVMTSADERDLIEQIENVYALDPGQRRLLTLANILKRPLRLEVAKWVEGGPYARWFDNVEDAVSLARLHTFDLEGLTAYPQVLELLVFYILHRANATIYDPDLADTFKVFVLDEAWRFFRHPVVKLYVIEALKTWRKKNAAVLLATQSADDLRQSDLLSVVVESCPTKLFLANPGMDRSAYRELFHLNETEVARVADLVPKRQFLIKQPHLAKVVDLHVDRLGYWLYTSDISDRRQKRAAFAEHGVDRGLEILAQLPASSGDTKESQRP